MSVERSSSKCKFLKSYLQTVIFQEQLMSLSIVLIENKIAKSLNYDDLLFEFVENQV
jgi:hypothetical protein